MSIHVEIIPNHGRKPSILLRRAWREGKRIRKEQLANLTRTPAFIVDGIRAMLKGGTVVNDISEVLAVSRSLPAARPCLRGPGGLPAARPAEDPRPPQTPAARSRARRRDRPRHRSGLQAGHRQGPVAGHRGHQPRSGARPRRGHRQRDAGHARLAGLSASAGSRGAWPTAISGAGP